MAARSPAPSGIASDRGGDAAGRHPSLRPLAAARQGDGAGGTPQDILLRVLAALPGGYALSALFATAVATLPMARMDAVLAGMMGSFAVHAGAIVWVFAAGSALRAWIGLALAAAPLLGLLLLQGGAS